MLDGNKAVGIDGETKRAYGEELEDNLRRLSQRLEDMAYRPQPKRRTYIPRPGSSKRRALAISCSEDKLAELATKRTLEPIYEPMFLEVSHGYRPERSRHGCLKELGRVIQQEPINHIVEADRQRENQMQRSLAVRPTQHPKRLPLQRVLLAQDTHVLRWVLEVGSLSCSPSTTSTTNCC